MSELTAKQARFVEEYLIDLNATQAAIRAGYSEDTARQIASENLSKVDIQTAIQTAKAARSKRTEITQDRVLTEIARLAFSDLRNVLNEDGHLVSPQDWDDATAASIASIEIATVGGQSDGVRAVDHIAKIKTWDKNSALEKLAKHLDVYAPARVDHTSSDKSMSAKPSVTLTSLSDEELAQLERLTDKARNSEGVGEAD